MSLQTLIPNVTTVTLATGRQQCTSKVNVVARWPNGLNRSVFHIPSADIRDSWLRIPAVAEFLAVVLSWAPSPSNWENRNHEPGVNTNNFHTRKLFKMMRNQNGIDSYRRSAYSQISTRLLVHLLS